MSAQHKIGKHPHELIVTLHRMHGEFVLRWKGALDGRCLSEHRKPVKHAVITQRGSAFWARGAVDHGRP
ncbi:hypothetical protein LMG23994_01613 [Cupriavidus pinatubonensis]|uniref:Transposase n=1 Tax=Cupriavidus pinatubonensis TaxID=248026 RepID=A0ABM8WQF7_9BURK|nr:hypothetical protein LMG23994_01613 [Cupriavidus pinatubonensis]